MSKYKVYFYWRVWKPNPFLTPNEIVEVEAPDDASENDVILLALRKVGTYPKTYAASVVKVESDDTTPKNRRERTLETIKNVEKLLEDSRNILP